MTKVAKKRENKPRKESLRFKVEIISAPEGAWYEKLIGTCTTVEFLHFGVKRVAHEPHYKSIPDSDLQFIKKF